MSESREERAARIREVMETEGDAVAEGTRLFNRNRKEAVEELDDYEALKAEARSIKEDAIERLPELIERVTETVEANGGEVYVADDAADANRYVEDVVGDADRLVKSKSMTTEEIDVNEALQERGVDVVETDLGEWVIQLAEEAPSHIVAPGIHKRTDEIAELFRETFDPDDPPETPEELTAFAREKLGDLIADADAGMTGANFVCADSGSIALVTSEGNARKTAVTPDTHVAVTGVEKILPSVEDLDPFLQLLARSGTGQSLTSYVSLFTPPTKSPTVDFSEPDRPLANAVDPDSGRSAGADSDRDFHSSAEDAGREFHSPAEDASREFHSSAEDAGREFHLVLIDNGRTAMREDEELRETLYCIRCGACSNACGNFQSVGGHVFGGETYSGGIATGWEAGVEGLDTAAEFNDLCTGCTRCVPACPVKIDVPWLNTVVRDRVNRGEIDAGDADFLPDDLRPDLAPDEEPPGMDLTKRLFGNAETLAKWGSKTAPISNRLSSAGPVRAFLDRALGVDRRRDLPEWSSETLVEWFRRRGGAGVSPADAEREAVLYPDLYTNYANVARGKAAVRTLEALGVHVRIPSLPGSGRAPLSQGMIATAESKAHDVYGGLAEHLDAGRDVVAVEPSDLAMFRRDYEKFLEPAAFERLSEASYEVFEYVYGLLHNGADPSALSGPGGLDRGRVAFHAHCQARTLDLEAYTVEVLETVGYDVRTSDTECCGMAGSFGYKSEYYELSLDVGEPLAEQFGDADGIPVASGTSCGEQLDALLDRPAVHPIKLVAPP